MKIIIILIIAFLFFLSKNKKMHQIAILLLSYFFANRNIKVPDTIPYMDMYELGTDYLGAEEAFLKLCEFANGLGLSFVVFLFILTFITLEIWYFCTKCLFGENAVSWMAILLFSYFGVYYLGAVLRSSIGIAICYLGMTVLLKKGFKLWPVVIYYALVFISYSIQQSTALFLIAPLALFSLKDKYLYIITTCALVLCVSSTVLPINDLLLNISAFMGSTRFNYYTDLDLTIGVKVFDLFLMIIGYIAIYSRKQFENYTFYKYYTFFLHLYVYALLVLSLVNNIPAGARLAMNWLYFEFVLVYFLVFKSNIIKTSKGFVAFIIVAFSLFMHFHSYPLFLEY